MSDRQAKLEVRLKVLEGATKALFAVSIAKHPYPEQLIEAIRSSIKLNVESPDPTKAEQLQILGESYLDSLLDEIRHLAVTLRDAAPPPTQPEP